ncbi:MAG: N-(5'-phosphoribosyl)anthranilate isomerase [Planctomycetes bacterium]|nr:N-(5'-phosphoribosyl)anthranilate isomerase [Planctomycetota bacterium]
MLVKICGLTSPEATRAAVDAGADAVGFVLAPSVRQVSCETARELLALVPDTIEKIAVFAQATREELEAAFELGFDAVQAELGSPVEPMAKGMFALTVLRDGDDLEQRAEGVVSDWKPGSLRGALVLDGPSGGGSGVPVDLERAQRTARSHPIVLAGGLTPANVAELIRLVRPIAVDTSSGVESERGLKDPEKIQDFVRQAHEAFVLPAQTTEEPPP